MGWAIERRRQLRLTVARSRGDLGLGEKQSGAQVSALRPPGGTDMWYFAWILGTLLACAFGVITALALEHVEATKAGEEKH